MSAQAGLVASADAARWIKRTHQGRHCAAQILCLPHAGGGAASLNGWRRFTPPDIELLRLQAPGREDRADEQPLDDIDAMIAGLLPAWLEVSRGPYAIYGHSLGALVGYALVRELCSLGARPPVRLFVSGRRAPPLPLSHPPYCIQSEAELLAYLRDMGATPCALLEKPRWREAFLPLVRADLKISDLYVHRPAAEIPCPITYFRGAADPLVSAEECQAWGKITSRDFALRSFPDGHFFSTESQQTILSEIVSVLSVVA